MYGAVETPSSTKSTGFVAICSCAALFSVVGFIAAQPASLYAPTALRPPVLRSVMVTPSSSSTIAPPIFATAAQREAQDWNIQRSGLAQVGATMMPIVLGVGALTTLITTLLFKSKNSIALAATAGQSTRGQSTRGQSTRGVPGSTRGQVSGSTRGQVSGSTRGQRSASTRGSASVEERLLWFPNVTPPAYLTGEFPGDRGFDPAGLSADPETFDRMRIAEIIHGRVAMLAVVGALVPDFLGKGNWFEAPAIAGIDIGDVQQFILGYGVFEFGRGLNKSSNPAAIYPGFDPLNLTSDYTKEAEIKNGRLALTAMLGFEVQRHVVGGSPLANLYDHLQQPLKFNIADSVMHPWPVAMFASTGSKDGLWFPNSKPPAHLISEYSTTATLVP